MDRNDVYRSVWGNIFSTTKLSLSFSATYIFDKHKLRCYGSLLIRVQPFCSRSFIETIRPEVVRLTSLQHRTIFLEALTGCCSRIVVICMWLRLEHKPIEQHFCFRKLWSRRINKSGSNKLGRVNSVKEINYVWSSTTSGGLPMSDGSASIFSDKVKIIYSHYFWNDEKCNFIPDKYFQWSRIDLPRNQCDDFKN